MNSMKLHQRWRLVQVKDLPNASFWNPYDREFFDTGVYETREKALKQRAWAIMNINKELYYREDIAAEVLDAVPFVTYSERFLPRYLRALKSGWKQNVAENIGLGVGLIMLVVALIAFGAALALGSPLTGYLVAQCFILPSVFLGAGLLGLFFGTLMDTEGTQERPLDPETAVQLQVIGA